MEHSYSKLGNKYDLKLIENLDNEYHTKLKKMYIWKK